MPKNDSQSGKCKKMQKKWLLVWEMQKKCKKMQTKCKKNAKKAKKMQKKCKKMQKKCEKNDSRAGKVAFLEFPGRPPLLGPEPPPRAISPRPRPPPRFLSRPCTPSRETTPRPGRPKNEFPRASSPALSFFTAGWLSKSFSTCSLYLVLPRDNKRSVMVVIFKQCFFSIFPFPKWQ